MLLTALQEDMLMQVAPKLTARELWDSLKVRFIGADRVKAARLATLRGEFGRLRMDDGDDLDAYAGKALANDFDKTDVWVQVLDLPPGRRTEELGMALGNWMGKAVRVDVDKEGIARGNQLRVRVKISVFQPLVRVFFLKSSLEDEGRTWYDFSYEKVPHFCFECGRLVHVKGVCEPPVDSSLLEDGAYFLLGCLATRVSSATPLLAAGVSSATPLHYRVARCCAILARLENSSWQLARSHALRASLSSPVPHGRLARFR
ncbi:retrotransposon protein [Hordeum vulgare]|nr:retrotransposon protein [Hordeum vulgare]